MTTRLIIVTGLLVAAGPAFGQYCVTNTSDPNYNNCVQQEEQWRKDEAERQQQATEAAYERQQQSDAEYAQQRRQSSPEQAAQARQQAEYDAGLTALRAKLLSSPALPPDRNPLLGRWRVATSSGQRDGAELSQLMGMLANPGGAMCEVVFGGGVVEFEPGSWASSDSTGDDSLGPIQYRTQDQQVFALPDQGLPLLGFEIVDGNTIREFRLQDCVLVRAGARPTAVSAAPAAQPAADASAAIAPARSAREPIEPMSQLGRGVQLHGEMEFQQALQQLLAAAQSDPDDPRVYVYLADTYRWLSMDAEAKQAAERAKQLDPNAFEILR